MSGEGRDTVPEIRQQQGDLDPVLKPTPVAVSSKESSGSGVGVVTTTTTATTTMTAMSDLTVSGPVSRSPSTSPFRTPRIDGFCCNDPGCPFGSASNGPFTLSSSGVLVRHPRSKFMGGSLSDSGNISPPRRFMSSGIMRLLTRWPLLLICLAFIGLELLFYFVLRGIVFWYEKLRFGKARSDLARAMSYEEWVVAAQQLDRLHNNDTWREISPQYDAALISHITSSLSTTTTTSTALVLSPNSSRKTLTPESSKIDFTCITESTQLITSSPGEPILPTISSGGEEHFSDNVFVSRYLKMLNTACKVNVGGVHSEQVYAACHYGTSKAIQSFVDQTALSINILISKATEGIIPQQVPLGRWADRLIRSYGRTALCLSGGAAMGFPHFGVILALLDAGMLPDVIAGTSAGALVAAFACVRTDSELRESLTARNLASHLRFNDESYKIILERIWSEGHMCSETRWAAALQWFTKGNTTFAEAYSLTGRVLNITVVGGHCEPHLLNYLTAPNVVIYTAILASAAMPLAFTGVGLLCKNEHTGVVEPFHDFGSTKWRDGCLKNDIPKDALSQFFNVKFTIVSQCNPHVIPFFFASRGNAGSPSPHRKGRGYRGGFLLSFAELYLKLDMLKWLMLASNLDLIPSVLGYNWSYLFLQDFGGTVTLSLKPHPWFYLHALSDPSVSDMSHYLITGKRMCWPKLCMVRNRMIIERALLRLHALTSPSSSKE